MSNTSGQAYALRILCPVKPGHLDGLREALARLGEQEDSPFATGTTHFGRFVIVTAIDAVGRGRPDPGDLSCPYLLMSCTLDGHDPKAYLEMLLARQSAALSEVFGYCIGFPEESTGDPQPAQLGLAVKYLLHNQIPVGLFYAAYDATVAEVRAALALRERFSAFAVGSQGLDPATLMANFREQFTDLAG